MYSWWGRKHAKLLGELFNILLPRRFSQWHGTTIAFLDVYLDILLGISPECKVDFHSIVFFSCVYGLTYSDSVIESLERIQHKVNEAERNANDFWDILLREWRRQEVFIVWLELVRTIIPHLSDVNVGCLDSIRSPDIPERTLYYYRGNYFVCVDEQIYFSSDFKAVLEKIYQLTPCQQYNVLE